MSGIADALRQLIGTRVYITESRSVNIVVGKNPYDPNQHLQNYTVISEVGTDYFKGSTYSREGKLFSVDYWTFTALQSIKHYK